MHLNVSVFVYMLLLTYAYIHIYVCPSNTFARRILISLSVDVTLLPRYVNLSTNFRGLLFRVKMTFS